MIIPTDSELNKMSKEEYERLLEEIKRKGSDSNKVNNTIDIPSKQYNYNQ